ncbi:hypothetical protein GCM10020256_30610 [Streptomyces thermocoprophilus]
MLGEAASDEGSGGDGEAVDGAPDAVGHAALGDGDGGREEGEGERHHDGRACALDGAGGDEGADAGCHGRRGGGGGEDGGADLEEAAPAEAVAEGRAGHEQDGEGECVGADGPFEVVQGSAEVLADGGQGRW